MTLSHFIKSSSRVASLVGCLALSNLTNVNSAEAFSVTLTNTDFETSTTGWQTVGDVTTIGSNAVQANGVNINPIAPGSNQAIITNAYNSRTDDVNSSGGSLSFNQSGTDPLDADTSTTTNPGSDVQTELGLPLSAFSIERNPSQPGNPRTSKEGSAIYQDFTVNLDAGETGFEISFNWAYLTNDGTTSFGNQDFAFLSVYDTASSSGAIEVLADSSGTITAANASNNFVQGDTTYYSDSNTYTYTVNGLESEQAYTYRIALGTIDVDGSDRSSALLVDNFQVDAAAVPFEFSPIAGFGLVAGFIGFANFRRRLKQRFQVMK
ncbi:conserved exported hypothetical protein [Hyella patelloides LEGE 07179]|uniref:PEP-CTERM sorting domain-containing protein n=1 Tax=Hyella patelloides LEGE 07179 TaxID=945734 RepID=A0A563VNA8_9CYAN|nr:hypothetical protein [Hyella patelloides]VEP12765.1 conserved exported hypothetical protein [Hyella patelloides LEGE 07179]